MRLLGVKRCVGRVSRRGVRETKMSGGQGEQITAACRGRLVCEVVARVFHDHGGRRAADPRDSTELLLG